MALFGLYLVVWDRLQHFSFINIIYVKERGQGPHVMALLSFFGLARGVLAQGSATVG
jgi:hypothetical protein